MNAGREDGGSDLVALCFLIHFRRRFALTPCSSASLDTETPGSRQARDKTLFRCRLVAPATVPANKPDPQFLIIRLPSQGVHLFWWTPHASEHSKAKGAGKFALTFDRGVDRPVIARAASNESMPDLPDQRTQTGVARAVGGAPNAAEVGIRINVLFDMHGAILDPENRRGYGLARKGPRSVTQDHNMAR